VVAQRRLESADQALIEAIFGPGRRIRLGEIWTVAGRKDYAGKPPTPW
jgi:hypothetical protein